jgi:hypothetical protein
LKRRNFFVMLGVLSLGLAFASRVLFSSGALEFEGTGPRGAPKGRLLGRQSTIPVYGPHRLWVFKTTVLTGVGKVRLAPPGSQGVILDVTKADQAYLPMRVRHALWPTRYSIAFENGYDAWVREVAGQIIYPPLLIPVPVLMTRGASDPEGAGGGISVVCDRECSLAVLHDRGQPTTVHLTVETLSPPVNRGSRSFEMSAFASMSDDGPVSLNTVPDLVALEKGIYRATGRFEPVALEIPAASRWYTVRIAFPDPATSNAAMKVVIAESVPDAFN